MASYPGSYTPNQQVYGPPPHQGTIPPPAYGPPPPQGTVPPPAYGYGPAVAQQPYYGTGPYQYQPYQPQKSDEHGIFALLGGVLLLISGISDLALGGFLTLFGTAVFSLMGGFDFGLGNFFMICGGIVIIMGIMGIIGAIFAFMKKYWPMCVLGAILAMLGIGFYSTGLIFGILGLIMVIIAKDAFQK